MKLLREYIRGLLIEQSEKKPNWEIKKSPIHGEGVFVIDDIPLNRYFLDFSVSFVTINQFLI